MRCVDEVEAQSGDRFATTGDLLLAAARELRAHGRPGEARPLFERAVSWWRQALREDGAGSSRHFAFGVALYEAGEFREAQRIFESLHADGPTGVDVIGACGVVAARLGKNDRATGASAQLASLRTRFLFGRNQLWMARIASLQGDRQAGVMSLRRAFARGHCHGIELHRDHDLDNLRLERSFVELTRPR